MVAQNWGSVVLSWVPTLKEAVPPPPPPPPPPPGPVGRGGHFSPGPALENSGGETDTGDNTADTPKGGGAYYTRYEGPNLANQTNRGS